MQSSPTVPLTPYQHQTGINLGYTQQDLLPITKQSVYQSSLPAIQDMKPLECQYYVEKKYKALRDRQEKIYEKIREAVKDGNRKQERKGFNPVIRRMLEQHQIRMQKKARYEERVRISKTRDAQVRNIRNTVDLGRTSPNFSSAKNSRLSSKQSMRSQDSRVSEVSTESHRYRLNLVRMKEKEAQKFRQNEFRYNEQKSRQKVEKVHESRLSASRKVRTKSQISQQAVRQRKQQLKSLHQDQIRDHIQKLKYKQFKQEYIRQRQQQKILHSSIPNNMQYKKQLKNMFQHNAKQQTRARYQSKQYSVERKKREIQREKNRELQNKIRDKKLKELQVMKFQQSRAVEEERRKKEAVVWEMRQLEEARNRKVDLQSQKKMKLMEKRIKDDIVRTNFNSIENKRKLDSQVKSKRMSEKLQEIRDIEDIKMKMHRERKQQSFKKVESLEQKFSFY